MDVVVQAPSQQLAVAPEIEQFVNDFGRFSRNTSDSIIGMGKVVFQAKTQLRQELFDQFCSAIRYDGASSAIRKLEKIGKDAEFLTQHSASLPAKWTTMYQLTLLGKEVLESAIESGEVFATMSGADANKLVSMHVPKKARKPKKPAPKADVEPEYSYKLALRFEGEPSREFFTELEQVILDLCGSRDIDCSLVQNELIQEICRT